VPPTKSRIAAPEANVKRWESWFRAHSRDLRPRPDSEHLTLSDKRKQLIEIVKVHGLTHSDEPVRLASGEYSRDFIDGKAALAEGVDLQLACEALIELVDEAGIRWDAVGGLTMGADQFAHVVAVLAKKRWFVVRKERKGRGTNKLVEGTPVDESVRVLLVDDVVTTGGSIRQAYEAIRETGAVVAGAVTLVDRGEVARAYFEAEGITYRALVTYADLDIDPVGGGLINA
jgi:orotate phosphoribosyltransferase